jgi:hypothetical protein
MGHPVVTNYLSCEFALNLRVFPVVPAGVRQVSSGNSVLGVAGVGLRAAYGWTPAPQDDKHILTFTAEDLQRAG